MQLQELTHLDGDDRLAGWLRHAGSAGGTGAVSVGIIAGGRRFFATLEPHATDNGRDTPILLGCLAKLLTATLALRLAGAPPRWTRDALAERLAGEPEGAPLPHGLELVHLLNHTHGLDDSRVSHLPRREDGLIDAAALCRALTADPPLAAPGALYSYSNAGAWLWAALLERAHARPFAALLAETLERDVGIRARATDEACPASGARLALTLDELLSFLEWHMSRENADAAQLRDGAVPLPGWTPAERAACQGWKAYGGDWFGHNAVLGDRSALLRFNATLGLGIAIGGERTRTFATFMRLFARALPEFLEYRPLKTLQGAALEALDFAAFEGEYASGALRLHVRRAAPARLGCVARGVAAPQGLDLPLRGATQNVFFPDARHPLDLPFLQFIGARADGRFDYLWNGKTLWRRAA